MALRDMQESERQREKSKHTDRKAPRTLGLRLLHPHAHGAQDGLQFRDIDLWKRQRHADRLPRSAERVLHARELLLDLVGR
ncbi:MAG: hypothetical protein LW636_10525, partial [Planctomycetaceae bacterium]|nr:hypothetical protein [Planctomycetaceae bacterium]